VPGDVELAGEGEDVGVFDIGDFLIGEIIEHDQNLFGIRSDGPAFVEVAALLVVGVDF
jgi:hypothetical protein